MSDSGDGEELRLQLEAIAETAVFDDRGLLTVVVQDVASGAVLMVAWANREALLATAGTGFAHFFSRSRKQLWKKGETSGNTLRVRSATLDCDRDSLLLRVFPVGPTCHTGQRSCFKDNPAQLELGWLSGVLAQRSNASIESSYTARLLAAGRERIAQKVGEEAVETVVAAVSSNAEESSKLPLEIADLLYHLLVLLVDCGIQPSAIASVMSSRHSDPAIARNESLG